MAFPRVPPRFAGNLPVQEQYAVFVTYWLVAASVKKSLKGAAMKTGIIFIIVC